MTEINTLLLGVTCKKFLDVITRGIRRDALASAGLRQEDTFITNWSVNRVVTATHCYLLIYVQSVIRFNAVPCLRYICGIVKLVILDVHCGW